jgi:hypothetical protein
LYAILEDRALGQAIYWRYNRRRMSTFSRTKF